MVKKLRETLRRLCVTSHLKAEEIKTDEDAMEVIQVVMLIAVGVIAIAAIWLGINGLLEQWWTAIIGGADAGQGGPNIPTN